MVQARTMHGVGITCCGLPDQRQENVNTRKTFAFNFQHFFRDISAKARDNRVQRYSSWFLHTLMALAVVRWTPQGQGLRGPDFLDEAAVS